MILEKRRHIGTQLVTYLSLVILGQGRTPVTTYEPEFLRLLWQCSMSIYSNVSHIIDNF